VLNAVEFYQDFLLTAGNDKKLKVFRVSEAESSLELSVHIKDLPIKSAQVIQGKVFLAGDRPFFYTFDLTSNKLTRVPGLLGHQGKLLPRVLGSPDAAYAVFLTEDGHLLFTSPHSGRLLFELKMNGSAQAASFADEETIYSGGSEGDVYEWDLRMRRCVRRFADEGSSHVTAMSATASHLACGSSSGVVNLYDRKGNKFAEGLPDKTLLNLTTSIDGVAFNASSELLVMHSRWKKDALRLVHVPSKTTYANWPNFKSHLMYPFCASFSEDSKYLSVGNEEGQAGLYKIAYYAS
jgi:U3 small nucleolar RNA-associated protein 18